LHVREHSETRLRQERVELFKRLARSLRQFGRNGDDYYLLKERSWAYRHLVLTNNPIILRSPVPAVLQSLLADYPDWEIVICVANRESNSEDVQKYGYEWPESQVVIRDDVIIDCLVRERLPREFHDLVIAGSRSEKEMGAQRMAVTETLRGHTEERLEKEWSELYDRLRDALQPYGEDAMDGGDYFLVDENYGRHTHQVEMHKLHMLRPEIIKALQKVLTGHPDWEIEISVSIPEDDIIIDPGEGLTLHDDEIIDALDRTLLPKAYQDLVYEGSRPPKKPGDVILPGGS
jgi:hypothetical protein